MVWRIGKNPEFTFSAWFDCTGWSGNIALPFSISWWNTVDVVKNRNIDISIHFLCFGFSLEIWFWNKEWLERKDN